MSSEEVIPEVDGLGEPSARSGITIGDVLCGAGLAIGVIASYVLIALTPHLLAKHGVLLESLNGSSVAIVTGGAFARVGRDSLVLVLLAPLVTVFTYDAFFWWAGRRWGNSIAAFYAQNNPRAARWIVRSERLVAKYGIWALISNYYLPIPNFVIFVACGTSGVPFWKFALGDLLGTLLWAGLLVTLGWTIGHPAVHAVHEISHYATRVTIGIIVVLILVQIIRGRRAMRASADDAAPSDSPST